MRPVSADLRAKSQGAFRTSQGVEWRVWAPRQDAVQLVLGEGAQQRAVSMNSEGDGYFSIELPDIAEGTRYAYCFGKGHVEKGQEKKGEKKGTRLFPDPASRWQPDGVHRPSAVLFPDKFPWTDQGWRGVALRDLVIYELHVGTFTPEGTFPAIIPRLESLRDLGITALEIMPVSQFPGARNWGYDGVHPYAAQNTYGGPHGLQHLVDAAHAVGLAVLLDVVYNHLGPEGNYLDPFGPYFTSRYHTPWGAALNYDGPESDPVRRYVIDNACQWIRDFHIDGLRLDAIQTIFDLSAYHVLAELQAAVQRTAAECNRSAVVIAETNQNDARLTASVKERGMGLDGVWSDDFHHAVHALLTGERDGYYVDFGEPEQLAKSYRDVFIYDGCFSRFAQHRQGSRVTDQPRERFVICIQNHDQIGNRALGDRLSVLLTPAAERLAAALLLISPNTPLLYMGQEYGESNPFPFFCSFGDPGLVEAVREGRKREFEELAFRWHVEIPDANAVSTFEHARLSWQWEGDARRTGLRAMYGELLAARRDWPGLVDREHCEAELMSLDSSTQLLVVRRGPPSHRLVIAANFRDTPVLLPPELSPAGEWRFASEWSRFGGLRTDTHAAKILMPHELVIWDAANG